MCVNIVDTQRHTQLNWNLNANYSLRFCRELRACAIERSSFGFITFCHSVHSFVFVSFTALIFFSLFLSRLPLSPKRFTQQPFSLNLIPSISVHVRVYMCCVLIFPVLASTVFCFDSFASILLHIVRFSIFTRLQHWNSMHWRARSMFFFLSHRWTLSLAQMIASKIVTIKLFRNMHDNGF